MRMRTTMSSNSKNFAENAKIESKLEPRSRMI